MPPSPPRRPHLHPWNWATVSPCAVTKSRVLRAGGSGGLSGWAQCNHREAVSGGGGGRPREGNAAMEAELGRWQREGDWTGHRQL